MVAERAVVRVQPGEVDDPPDPGLVRGDPEGAGELAVALDEATLAVHRVQEVVRDVDALERRGQGVGRARVALDDLDLVAPPPLGHLGVVTGQRPHLPPLLEEAGHQARADVAGDAGDQGPAGLGHRRSSAVAELGGGLVAEAVQERLHQRRGVPGQPGEGEVGAVDDGRAAVARCHRDGVVARRGVVAADDDEAGLLHGIHGVLELDGVAGERRDVPVDGAGAAVTGDQLAGLGPAVPLGGVAEVDEVREHLLGRGGGRHGAFDGRAHRLSLRASRIWATSR